MSIDFKRSLVTSIKEACQSFPVIALTGPRQSGKTTLLRTAFSHYKYISLENPDVRQFAHQDPNAFLAQFVNAPVILDEVQRVPELFSYIQTLVDERKTMGHFILSGSQNFLLLKSITQSLAGRAAVFTLLPLDFTEYRSGRPLPSTYAQACINGFYPAVHSHNIPAPLFYSSYIKTYVEKDVTEILNIRNQAAFRRFLRLLAGRAGQLLEYSTLANECDITVPTAREWISVLESSFIVFQLTPYHENFGKRLLKSPKLYFYDTGLLCYLLELADPEDIMLNRLKGNIFENLVIAEYVKQNHHTLAHKNFYFWKDSNGNEIDLLYTSRGQFIASEIKATATIKSTLFAQLDKFAAAAASHSQQVQRQLIYGGVENQQRTQYAITGWPNIKI